MQKKYLGYLGLAFVLSAAIFGLSSCKNGNLFGGLHDRGDSSDPEILVAEAQIALNEGNYTEAVNLYNKALSADPDNAKALYGATTASLAAAGLNIGQLVANLTKASGAPSLHVNNMADLIRTARVGASGGPVRAPNANSILAGIDLVALDAVLDVAICRLQKIVSGVADGSIPKENIDVMVNLGTVYFLRAVVRPIRANVLDITNDGHDFDVVQIDGTTFNNICSTNDELIVLLVQDVINGYALFKRAATILGLADDKLIAQIRDDIDEAAVELLDNSNPNALPNDCLTILTGMGINSTTFRNITDVFVPVAC